MSEDTKQELVKSVREASKILLAATARVKEQQPLAASVPVIVELDMIAKSLNAMLIEINRLRGL